VWYYITGDGVTYPLELKNNRWIYGVEGTGMAAIEWVTQRGPFQHGETISDYFLRPRTIQFLMRAVSYCGQTYWALREDLLDVFRPNRGDGTLRYITASGTIRDIKANILQGPDFPQPIDRSWDHWSIDTVVRLIAHDPIFYNPVIKSLTAAVYGGLTFPITFPITFTASGFTTYINYLGNWLTHPTFVLTGPFQTPIITNVTTSETITLAYTAAIGETVTISLQYGAKSIISDVTGSLLGYLTSTSDLATFHLNPGINQLVISATGTGGGTNIVAYWYDRYIGLGGLE